MPLWNTTTYPTSEVRDLVRFGFGAIGRGVLVWVKPTRGSLSAMSYDHLPELLDHGPPPGGVRAVAILRVGPESRFPCSGRYPGLDRAPDYEVRCWHEALVVLAAHEAEHLLRFEQRRAVLRKIVEGRARSVRGDSELRCEREAVRALARFRRGHVCLTPVRAAA